MLEWCGLRHGAFRNRVWKGALAGAGTGNRIAGEFGSEANTVRGRAAKAPNAPSGEGGVASRMRWGDRLLVQFTPMFVATFSAQAASRLLTVHVPLGQRRAWVPDVSSGAP